MYTYLGSLCVHTLNVIATFKITSQIDMLMGDTAVRPVGLEPLHGNCFLP